MSTFVKLHQLIKEEVLVRLKDYSEYRVTSHTSISVAPSTENDKHIS